MTQGPDDQRHYTLKTKSEINESNVNRPSEILVRAHDQRMVLILAKLVRFFNYKNHSLSNSQKSKLRKQGLRVARRRFLQPPFPLSHPSRANLFG